MKKFLSFLTFVMVAAQLMAAPVDVSTAKNKAERYISQKVYAGKIMTLGATDATLVKAEMGETAKTPVYYIFNTATTFVIVSGDDRAEEILAYGDNTLNPDRIPKNMQAWLDGYREQLDWLLTHPDAKVDKSMTYKSPKLKATTYGPLLTALWDQEAPYWNQCKFTYNGSSYMCYTGCPATSASMVLYYWKYPTAPVGPVPAYEGTLDIGQWNSVNYTYPALPEVTFDWDNMIDDYTSENATGYTTAQANAVATLMRYVGQAEHMKYGTPQAGGSGIYTADSQIIADMFIGFGYDSSTTRLVQKTNYNDAGWAQLIQEEMIEGRPIVFLGTASSAGGHAFNVDGYDSSTNKYHINFGWSGEGNSWCALNAFIDDTGANFNDNQIMILGIQPSEGMIRVTPSTVDFQGFAGETYTHVLHVKAHNIQSNVNIAISGDNAYTVSHTTLTPEEAINGVDVTVTYAPTQGGENNATLTFSCDDANVETVTVPITGVARPRVPTLIVEPTSLDFTTSLSRPLTKTISLTGVFLTGNATLTLNDNNGIFSVIPTAVPQSSISLDTPVEVAVTFNPVNEGRFSASLVIASEGAESVTVELTGRANEGNTASDPYLDISKYETIDEAGWNTNDIRDLYKYTEYENDECGWLTISNYGVIKADATQNWFTNSGTIRTGSETWTATDVFLGSASYFSGEGQYADWSEDCQTFFVTNCLQVKQLAVNRSNSTYPLKMYIYECTLNDDGTVTPSETAVQTKQNTTTNTAEVLASDELDPSKIYKVAIFNDFSKLYEIGFKTQLNTIETPVATAATDVKANGFTANWTLCPSAATYTLRIMPKPNASLLISETFANCTSVGAQDVSSNLDNYLDNPGWTGSKLYTAVGGLRLGTGNYIGSLTSPALDLSGDNKVSARIKAQTLNTDTNCELKISCGDASETITVPDNNVAEYTVVLDCTAADQDITFETTTKNKRVVITEIELYSGDINKPSKGFGEIIISGITDLSYAVTDLQPATTYLYDVKAVNGPMQGNWSNKIEVVTLAGGPSIPGDVDGDGEVTSYDVTLLYNVILNGDESGIVNGDQDGDGVITSSDVTLVYNILLGV
ncbi:MAG: C10 family peptidase [Muribaculaceae bacterium]|nr:C10 family peptidase [Muribaculaceae bacterium]